MAVAYENTMNCQFDALTYVFFSHDYFLSTKFEGLTIRAEDSSTHKMVSEGLIFKPVPGGFRILYETEFAGRQRSRASIGKEPFILSFRLFLNAPAFYNYTANLSRDITQSIFYFCNTPKPGEAAFPAGLLHAGDYVSEKDLHPVAEFPNRFFAKPFGLLDLEIREGMEEAYRVNFLNKATFWRYIVISDHLRGLNNPAVTDTSGGETFDGPAEIRLPDSREALAFTSRDQISWRESGNKTFQLVENFEPGTGKYKVVLSALPVPDINIISNAGSPSPNGDPADFSEIIIY